MLFADKKWLQRPQKSLSIENRRGSQGQRVDVYEPAAPSTSDPLWSSLSPAPRGPRGVLGPTRQRPRASCDPIPQVEGILPACAGTRRYGPCPGAYARTTPPRTPPPRCCCPLWRRNVHSAGAAEIDHGHCGSLGRRMRRPVLARSLALEIATHTFPPCAGRLSGRRGTTTSTRRRKRGPASRSCNSAAPGWHTRSPPHPCPPDGYARFWPTAACRTSSPYPAVPARLDEAASRSDARRDVPPAAQRLPQQSQARADRRVCDGRPPPSRSCVRPRRRPVRPPHLCLTRVHQRDFLCLHHRLLSS